MDRSWWSVAWQAGISVLVALLVSALLLLVSSQPRGDPIQLLPAPSPRPVIVHVSGAVVHPGIQSLPPGSRVNDAIQAAGGLLPEADSRGINLAAVLEDGQMLLVPVAIPDSPPAADEPLSPPSHLPETPEAPLNFPININIATQTDLETLPGIGPVIAQRIIEYRSTHGPFASIESIQDVSGIGPVTFEKIKDLITVGISP